MNTKKMPLPGFRTIKTAIAVLACLLLYLIIKRQNVLLALFASFLCMQDSVKSSVQSGVYRIFGTVAGGAFGLILLLMLGGLKEKTILWYSVISIGVIVLIYFFNIVRRNDSISIALIVFLIIMLDTSLSSHFMYTINYVIDSIIGIVIAVAINRLPLGYTSDRGAFRDSGGKLIKLSYEIKGSESHIVRKWSGGSTTELAISPDNSVFADKLFDWRISCATTAAQESEFSDFSGFMRHIMVLDGSLTLVHDGHHTTSLSLYEQDYFDGCWRTKGYGVCKDFNLILAENFDGKLLACENNGTYFLKGVTQNRFLNSVCAVYCPVSHVSIAVFSGEKLIMREDLSEGELILFEGLDEIDGALKFIPFTKETTSSGVVCIAVYIAKK